MSCALDFSSEARDAWRRLDLSLQEDLLDELDAIAQQPGLLRRISLVRRYVFDFIRDKSDTRHYLFLILRYEKEQNLLTVLQLGHVARRLDEH